MIRVDHVAASHLDAAASEPYIVAMLLPLRSLSGQMLALPLALTLSPILLAQKPDSVPTSPAASLRPLVQRFFAGKALRRFEQEFETHRTNQAAIDRAMPWVQRAVQAFFGGGMSGVGQTLDQGHAAMRERSKDETMLAALSLVAVPETRWLDAATFAKTGASVQVQPFYAKGFDLEADTAREPLLVELTLFARPSGVALAQSQSLCTPLNLMDNRESLAFQLKLSAAMAKNPVADGDYELRLRVLDAKGEATLTESKQTLSISNNRDARLLALLESTDLTKPTDSRAQTLRSYARFFDGLKKGRTYETDIAAAALLAHAEALAQAPKELGIAPLFATMPGDPRSNKMTPVGGTPLTQRRLIVQCDAGPVRCRLGWPTQIKPGPVADATLDKVPLVVLMHGAGGSENLFFDGHGDGLAVRLGSIHSFVVVAVNTGARTDAIADLPAKLAEHLPVDLDRTFVIGHSMGAMRGVAMIQDHADTFLGFAALSGGIRSRSPEAFAAVDVFIAAGDKDFGQRMAKTFENSLVSAHVHPTWRTIVGAEHFTMVQLALPEVFQRFATLQRPDEDRRTSKDGSNDREE